MSDPLTNGTPQPADTLSGLERDARVEQLLLQGLDHYFGGDYDKAIHVWTRVLFLDRGHARARAYIERARSAQAERQRESEELLHRGVAAFDRGDAGDARELLTAAVSHGASPEVALSYLGRLDRLEPAQAPEQPLDARTIARPAVSPPLEPASRWGTRQTILTVSLATCAGVIAIWAGIVLFELSDLRAAFQMKPAASVQPSTSDEPVPLPRIAELALARARSQFAGGHAHEALQTLEAIGPYDPLQTDADRLRAEIQRMLLAAAAPIPPTTRPSSPVP
jgi:tetratricopeptide (TPR) repeat protein